jgi:hypothetical protein
VIVGIENDAVRVLAERQFEIDVAWKALDKERGRIQDQLGRLERARYDVRSALEAIGADPDLDPELD